MSKIPKIRTIKALRGESLTIDLGETFTGTLEAFMKKDPNDTIFRVFDIVSNRYLFLDPTRTSDYFDNGNLVQAVEGKWGFNVTQNNTGNVIDTKTIFTGTILFMNNISDNGGFDVTQGYLFTGLEDTPNMLGSVGQAVVVNNNGDALEFVDINSVINLDKNDIGLGNVDNTSDLDKPISTATQTALDGKEDSFTKNTAFNKDFGTFSGTVAEGNHEHDVADIVGLQAELDNKENTFTKNTAFNKDFGTGNEDVSRGNHTHIKSEITDFNDADYATASQGALADTAVQPSEISTFETRISANEDEIIDINSEIILDKARIVENETDIATLQNNLTNTNSRIDDNDTDILSNRNDIDNLQNSRGVAGGIATLDNDGLIPLDQINNILKGSVRVISYWDVVNQIPQVNASSPIVGTRTYLHGQALQVINPGNRDIDGEDDWGLYDLIVWDDDSTRWFRIVGADKEGDPIDLSDYRLIADGEVVTNYDEQNNTITLSDGTIVELGGDSTFQTDLDPTTQITEPYGTYPIGTPLSEFIGKDFSEIFVGGFVATQPPSLNDVDITFTFDSFPPSTLERGITLGALTLNWSLNNGEALNGGASSGTPFVRTLDAGNVIDFEGNSIALTTGGTSENGITIPSVLLSGENYAIQRDGVVLSTSNPDATTIALEDNKGDRDTSQDTVLDSVRNISNGNIGSFTTYIPSFVGQDSQADIAINVLKTNVDYMTNSTDLVRFNFEQQPNGDKNLIGNGNYWWAITTRNWNTVTEQGFGLSIGSFGDGVSYLYKQQFTYYAVDGSSGDDKGNKTFYVYRTREVVSNGTTINLS